MEEKHKINQVPAPVDFLLHTPLYKTFSTLPFQNAVDDLKYFKGIVDCFCTGCGKHATFQGDTPSPDRMAAAIVNKGGMSPLQHSINSLTGPETFQVKLRCTRERSHLYYFIFLVDTKYFVPPTKEDAPVPYNTITKIGQFPSYSDINTHSLPKYRKVLSKDLFADLTRAINLYSHDIGAGSFVYLRRIFESLIQEATREVTNQNGWSEEEFKSMHMDEKIAKLKDYIPLFLYENRVMYAILSKGIHELSESECLNHFNVIKAGIEIILDEKIEKAERELKIAEAKKAIQQVHQSIKAK